MRIFAPVINQLKNQCYEKDYYTPKVTDGDRFYRMEPIGFCTSVQNRPQQGLFRQGANTACGCPFHEEGDWHKHDRSPKGYYKTKFNVYYGDKKIDAMASSFKEIGDGYAKDAFNVFYYGKKIDGASASTFKVLDGGYSKDAFNVFYYGKKVDGASASTFKYTGDGYAQDAFNAYYRGRKLD